MCGLGQSAPWLCPFNPPNQFFALAPRLAIWTRRSPVIYDAAIIWPGESPAVTEQVMRITLVRAIPILFRKHAAVNPCPAGRASVILEILNLLELFAIDDRPAIDLVQYL